MSIAFLTPDLHAFPPTHLALKDPNGLLAMGGDLSPTRLLSGYSKGIFPWYSEPPILWWAPNPRAVFLPHQVHCSRSLAKHFQHAHWKVTLDKAFQQVLESCAAPRPSSPGTWITHSMQEAYLELHRLGFAHSIEVWDEDLLVGGLYGVGLGKIFFGESMFSRRTNASKMALVIFARWLFQEHFLCLDAQVPSAHIETMGVKPIPRQTFEAILKVGTHPTEIDNYQNLWQTVAGKSLSYDGYINH